MNAHHPETECLHWPPERIRALQLERLRETLARARHSPYYAARLDGAGVATLEDLTQLPLTSKEDVRSASPDGLLAVVPEELFQYHESYGTTGTPTSSWLTRQNFANYAAQINQAAVDFHPGDKVLIRFPYAISVPAHIFTEAAHSRGACVIPASSRTEISPYPRVLDLLGKLRTTVLCCLPTEAIWLAETARLLGRDSARDFPHLRALCVAGELLSDARSRRLSALWNCPVYNLYGCTEAGNIAASCSAGRLHLFWDHFLLEVLAEGTGKPVAPGELGLAVLTTLTRQAMPLVRFQLGDWIRLLPGSSCSCGRTAPLVQHFGRDLNRFEFAGQKYFVRDLEERLLTAPVTAVGNFWLVEVRPDEVRFRVEAEQPDLAGQQELKRKVREELGLPLEIETVPPGALMDRSRLLRVAPVGKPRMVQMVAPGAPAPTLDDLR